MTYGLGIDLGTSFTSAAVSGAHGTRMVPLGPGMIVPSVAYPAQGGSVLTGPAALAAAADPALVARGFKRRLGDPTPLVLGGAAYSPSMLMAAQLRDVLATVSRTSGGPPSSIVLTCPAIWGPYRREQFAEVPRLAGITDYQLVTEPEAAATHYSAERRLGDGEVVAVYDLGGGTFDTTILRMRAGGMEILGTPEGIEHMGGIDFDETLLAHLDDRLGGAISATRPRRPGGGGNARDDPRDDRAGQGRTVHRAGCAAVRAAAVRDARGHGHPAGLQRHDPAVGQADRGRVAPHHQLGRDTPRRPVRGAARRRLVPDSAGVAAGGRGVRQAGAGDAAPEVHRGTRRGRVRRPFAAGRRACPATLVPTAAMSPSAAPQPSCRRWRRRGRPRRAGSGWCRRSPRLSSRSSVWSRRCCSPRVTTRQGKPRRRRIRRHCGCSTAGRSSRGSGSSPPRRTGTAPSSTRTARARARSARRGRTWRACGSRGAATPVRSTCRAMPAPRT